MTVYRVVRLVHEQVQYLSREGWTERRSRSARFDETRARIEMRWQLRLGNESILIEFPKEEE